MNNDLNKLATINKEITVILPCAIQTREEIDLHISSHALGYITNIQNKNITLSFELNRGVYLNIKTKLDEITIHDNINTQLLIKQKNIPTKNKTASFNEKQLENQELSSKVISSIFAPETSQSIYQPNKTIDKIATVDPPSNNYERAQAINKEETPVPEQFSELNNTKCKKFISTLEEFIEETSKAKYKNVDLSEIEKIQDPRQRALAMEQAEIDASLNIPIYIVNDKVANLTLNDLNINAPLNIPINLKNYSAKRLANSVDLKNMINAGYIKFINPNEINKYANMHQQDNLEFGLQTFDRKEAEQKIYNEQIQIDEENEMIITDESLNMPTEQESLAKNLTTISNIPETQPTNKGIKTSYHGNKHGQANKIISKGEFSNQNTKKTIKPIRKI